MEHEYDELVEDEYSSKGHYDLLVRQGSLIGLTAVDFANVAPLRTSMAVFTAGNGSREKARGRIG